MKKYHQDLVRSPIWHARLMDVSGFRGGWEAFDLMASVTNFQWYHAKWLCAIAISYNLFFLCLGTVHANCCRILRMHWIWQKRHRRNENEFYNILEWPSLTLSQWSSSGNPVAIQCTWHLHPSVYWNATGEIILVASVLPVVFQWSTSGFPVVFQCVPIMQINTGSPLGHHWVLASASVVPVAFQCTCGSSGLPVCSNYAN